MNFIKIDDFLLNLDNVISIVKSKNTDIHKDTGKKFYIEIGTVNAYPLHCVPLLCFDNEKKRDRMFEVLLHKIIIK